jgi:hypothetical protein
MAVRSYNLPVSSGTNVPFTDVYAFVGPPESPAWCMTEDQNVSYRQLFLQAAGADVLISTREGGSFRVRAVVGTGFPGVPFVLGPFETGPLKFTDLFASGSSGSQLMILGVLF